jgi:hypothetical protein
MKKKTLTVNDIGDDPTPTIIDAQWTGEEDVVGGLVALAKGVAIFGKGQMNLTATGIYHNGHPVPDVVYVVPLGFSSFVRNWGLAVKLMILAFRAKCGKKPALSIRATNVTTEVPSQSEEQ